MAGDDSETLVESIVRRRRKVLRRISAEYAYYATDANYAVNAEKIFLMALEKRLSGISPMEAVLQVEKSLIESKLTYNQKAMTATLCEAIIEQAGPSARFILRSDGARIPDVSSSKDKAYFWTYLFRYNPNIRGSIVAEQYVTAKGGVTLESTIRTAGIDPYNGMPLYEDSSPASVAVWKEISAEYGSRTSGTVTCILVRPVTGGIWNNVERNIVKTNPSVTSVIELDLITGIAVDVKYIP